MLEERNMGKEMNEKENSMNDKKEKKTLKLNKNVISKEKV